ncbi:nuclear transport factor 2 family protein [Kribbella sp. NPDC051586]|uniref:nuclear transport factor 2 family protein n=1 Tax=Kribbella sp. NPDC051586 TaxID=3364118 RepID=UPI00378E4F66
MTIAAIDALRAAGERGDADAVGELLAPDVVFHSPLTARISFEGRDEVVALHRDIFAVLEDIQTSDPLEYGDQRAFVFRARVRGLELEAMNLARCNDQGKIAELTVFIRPLPALAALFTLLPPRVATRRRGPVVGTLVGLLAAPLAFAFRTADRLAPHFLGLPETGSTRD